MATPRFWGLLVALIALVPHLVTAQEFCVPNQCSNGETCYNRPGSTVSSYACLCTNMQVGYDCSQNVFTRVLESCYGTECQSGRYSSPNYPAPYNFREVRVYLLFIPGATEITFVFSDPFQVEQRKDELYIGAGLTYDDILDLNGTDTPSKQIYFYENSIVPQPLTLFNTDSAFITWKTDKNIELLGFEVTWTAVFDRVLPIATCPADTQREVGLGQTSSQVFFIAPTATDNSGVVPTIVSQTHAPNDVFGLGITQVTYTFADGSGNQASCSFNVIVVQVDTIPPVVNCPQDFTQTVEFGTTSASVNFVTPTATDNSGVAILDSSSHLPGAFFVVGQTQVTYRFRDGSNNFAATCQFFVNLVAIDRTPPVATCPADIQREVGLGQTSIQVFFTAPTAIDNSGLAPTITSQTHATTDFFTIGNTQVTWTFADASGNQDSCSFNVNIVQVDRTPPVATCPADIVREVGLGQTSTQVFFTAPTAIDNSGQVPTITSQSHSTTDFFNIGSTQVTWTFADANGNQDSCSFNVIIVQVDRTPPVATCPADIVREVGLGQTSTQVFFTAPTAIDNSGQVPTVTSQSHSTTDFFNIGSTQVTWTFADANGNQDSCSFNVIIVQVDRTPPVATCPADIVREVGLGQTSTQVFFTAPTAIDNSGQVPTVTSQSHSTTDFFNIGSTQVTWTFADANGNQDSCSFNVIIVQVDRTPPVATCPADIVREVGLGQTSTQVFFTAPTAIDNSGQVPTVTSQSHSTTDFFNIGSTQVTWTFADANGNQDSCSFNVIIVQVDRTPPVATCPADIVREVGLGQTSTQVFFTAPTAIDNSGQVPTVTSQSHSTTDFFNIGSTQVTWTFADANGNQDSCSFNVIIVQVDRTPPVATCPADIVREVGLGQTSTQVFFTAPTAIDNSGQVPTVTSQSHSTTDFFNIGSTQVTWTFADANGNQDSCSFNVIIVQVDRTPPVATCPADIQREVGLSQTSTQVFFTAPTAIDNSGQVPTIISQSHSTTDFFNIGSTQVTWTFADANGNQDSCSFNVIIVQVDRTPPVATCPADIQREVGLSQTSTQVFFTAPTAIDNSGQVPTIISQSHSTTDFFNIGSTQVTWTFADANGNQDSCSFNVIIVQVDRTPPVATCPADIQREVGLSQTSTQVFFTAPTAIDNSGQVPTIISQSHSTTDFFNIGSTQVTWTFADANGNQDSCSFNVIIVQVDRTPPVATCPADIQREVGLSQTSTQVFFTAPTAIDNSGQVPRIISQSHSTTDFFNIGSTQVTWTFADANGNQDSCSFNVIIVQVDRTPPVATCPADIQREVGLSQTSTQVFFTAPTAIDNSGQVPTIISQSHSTTDFFNIGSTQVTWTFADANGNQDSCSFNVIIVQVDRTPPVATCPADIQREVGLSQTSTQVFFTAPTAIDNSGQVPTIISQSHSTTDFFNIGSTQVTWTFADANGNQDSCSFNVIIVQVDRTPPVATCPADIQREVGLSQTSTQVFFTAPTAIDNSGQVPTIISQSHSTTDFFNIGNTQVTWTFADANGNQDSCSFNVIIVQVDRTPPVATCPADIQREVGLSQTSTQVFFTAPTAIDNSGQVPTIISQSHSTTDFFNIGNTQVTWTFADANGNQDSCSFNVIIVQVDRTPPVATCPADIQREVGLSQTSTQVFFTAPTAIDNSGQVPTIISQSHSTTDFFNIGNTQVTWTFADANGNQDSCSFNVIIVQVDRTPPVATCPADIQREVGLSQTSTQVFFTAPTAIDNSGQVPTIISQSHSTTDFFNIGNTQVTWTFADANGNQDSCSFNVIIVQVDRTPPVATCPADIQREVGLSQTSTQVFFTAPTAIDNSGQVPTIISQSHSTTDFFNIGNTQVTWTFADANGNQDSCSFNVIIVQVDRTPPVATCPADIQREVGLSQTRTQVFFTAPTAIDNSGQVPTIISQSHSTTDFFDLGNTQVTWTFADANGNQDSCSFNVIIVQVDRTPPVATCPADIQREVGLSQTSTQVFFTAPTAIDNSGQVPTIISQSHSTTDFFNIGNTQVTWTFADANGNQDSCSFNVIIVQVDRTPPVATCPADIQREVGLSQTRTQVFFTAPTAIDNSGQVPTIISQSHSTTDFFDLGNTQVTWTFADANGNQDSCSFNVIIVQVDRTPPVATCPADIQREVGLSQTRTQVFFTAPTAIDNSGQVPTIISQSHSTTDFFDLGNTQVTWTFADANGNQDSCSFNVIIVQVDRTPPVATCPADIQREVGLSQTRTQVFFTAPTAIDNSGQVPTIISQSHSTTDFFDLGNTQVTWTFADANGNQDSCSFNVIIVQVDRTPPVATCPADIQREVGLGQTSVQVFFTAPTAIDNSGQVPTITSQTHATTDFFTIGNTQVTWTFADASGNQDSCSFNVNIVQVDRTPPVATCPADIQREVGLGQTSVQVFFTAPTAIDNSGQVPTITSQTHATTDFFTIGNTQVTWTFADASGNQDSCSFNVNIVQVDRTPPVATCPADIQREVGLGQTSVQVFFTAPTAIDNSGQVPTITSQTHATTDFFTIGNTQVTWTFADASGNQDSCSFNVNIVQVDRTPPVATCPADIQREVGLGQTSVQVFFTAPTAIDNSGQVPTITSQTHATTDFFTIGNTQVTWTFADASGNQDSCSFNVNIVQVDRTPPVATCPADIQREVGLGQTSVQVFFTAPTAIDNSGQVPTITSQTHATTDFFTIGNTQVTWTFADASGNQDSCSFNVNIVQVDRTPPVATCPADIQREVGLGQTSVQVFFTAPTAIDNSGQVPTITSQTHATTDFFTIGNTQVTWTFADASGNQDSCSFNVNIVQVDRTPPVATCPADIQREVGLSQTRIQVFFTAPTAIDNSGLVPTITSQTHSTTDFFDLGNTQVTWTFADANGNQDSCSFNVNIVQVDRTPPVATCPADIRREVGLSQTSSQVFFTAPTATDNSGLVPTIVSQSHATTDFFTPGTTQVTWTFADANGNQDSCSFNVIIVQVDRIPPVLVCPEGFSELTSLGLSGLTVTWISATATDNSGEVIAVTSDRSSPSFLPIGETLITYSASDASGNVAMCSFTITVIAVDNELPVISNCPPSPLNTAIDLGQTSAQVTWPTVVATDNSGVVNILSRSHISGDSFPVGATTVTIEFVDPSSNTAQCLFVVNVIQSDPVPPLITGCPGDIERSISLEATDIAVFWTPPATSDNSGLLPSIISNFSPGNRFAPGVWNVIYTSTDGAGNTQQCQFQITITRTDNIPPQVTCPANIRQTVIIGSIGTYVTWDPPVVSDNSGTVEFVSSSSSSGDLFPIGVTPVTYTYSDSSGNSNSCTFTVTITTGTPCNQNLCLNGGLCVPTDLTNYQCICTECFTGTNCETNLNACTNNLCENGAVCTPDPGSCTDYSCQCSGCFTGRFCNLPIDSCENHQCQNGGSCTVDPLNCELYTCTCPLCFTGQFCEQEVSACTFNLCANGANCIPVGQLCTEYKCSCPGCFTGAYCNEVRDACFENPCLNGGACSPLNDGNCFSYTCECTGCSTGYNCEIAIPSPCTANPCQNGGNCLPIQGQCAAYQCQCPANFGGLHCETVVTTNPNPCNSFPCLNGAECLTMDSQFYTCLCRTGFAGINCNQPSVGQNIDLCLDNPCQNGATCVASYHSSLPNFYTPQYYCICAIGFTGTNCLRQTVSSPSEDICNVVRPDRPDCQGGAPCFNSYQSITNDVDYYCDCPIGLTGHNCETVAPDPCASAPCQNGGNCMSFNTYYTCSCPLGFFGDQCQVSNDATQPSIVGCPEDIELQLVFGQTRAFGTWQEPTSPDGVRVFRSDAPSSLFPLGTSSVSYVFEDVSENRATCTFFVRVSGDVVDDQPPSVFGCPGDITLTLPIGSQTTMAIWQVPGATDNNGPATLTSNYSPGDSFPAGITEVVYVATDSAGLTARCSFNVIAQLPVDDTPPTIQNCPEERFASLPAGSTSVPVVWPVPIASDNSGQVTLSSNYNPGDVFPAGQTLVFYAAKDPYGLLTSCTFTVFVSTTGDLSPPVINGCPETQVVSALQGSTSAQVTWTPPTATDNSGFVTITGDSTPGSSFPVGTSTVRYEARDQSGLVTSCTFQVLVTQNGGDTVPPVISSCPSDQFATLPVGASTVTVSWIEPTATDNIVLAMFISNFNPGASFSLGSRTVTYTATDSSGLQAFCSFSVIVSGATSTGDTTPPVLSGCPATITLQVPNGTPSAVATWTPPTATDSQGTASVVSNGNNPGSSYPVGSTTVIYTATDEAGLQSKCAFNILVTSGGGGTVVDGIPPVLMNCPNAVFGELFSSSGLASVSWELPSATDDGVAIDFTSGLTFTSAFFPEGRTGPFSWRFSDAAGNEVTCELYIFAAVARTDTTPPSVTSCPGDVTAASSDGLPVPVTWTEPTASDGQTAVLTISSTRNTGDSFGVGTTPVRYTFIDDQANTANCDFNVIVTGGGGSVDNNPPVVTGCPSTIVLSAPAGATSATATWTPPTASDAETSATIISDANPGISVPVGGNRLVTYTASDVNGLQAICSFNIIVSGTAGNQAPQLFNCPASASGVLIPPANSVAVLWTPPTATDDSGTPALTSTFQPGSQFFVGVTPVTYTARDAAGLATSCSFQVTVTQGTAGNQAPQLFNCPASASGVLIPPANSVAVLWTPPTATDDSGTPALTSTFQPGSQFFVGVTPVTYTARDAAGLATSCSFQVTVTQGTTGNQPPQLFNCPQVITRDLPSTSNQVSVFWTAPTATDDFDTPTVTPSIQPGSSFQAGSTPVTYTATDSAGLSTTCSFSVIVIDVTDPMLVGCPSGATGMLLPGQSQTTVTWNPPTSSDNSGQSTQTSTYSPPASFPFGNTQVTYTVTDDAGNSAMCTFTVTVTSQSTDTTPPEIVCPGNQEVLAPNGQSVLVNWNQPTPNEQATLVASRTSNTPFNVGRYAVVYTATDPSGNVGQCSFYVTVTANDGRAPPVINNCPQDAQTIVYETYNSVNCSARYTEPSSIQAGVAVTVSPANSSPLNNYAIGDYLIVYSFTNQQGYQTDCAIDLSVIQGVNICRCNPCPDPACYFNPNDDQEFYCPNAQTQGRRKKRKAHWEETVEHQLEFTCACEHGGRCLETPEGDVTCQCRPGYSGILCQHDDILKVDVPPALLGEDACSSSPCLHNGTCIVQIQELYTCFCLSDWTGQNCESYFEVHHNFGGHQDLERVEDRSGFMNWPTLAAMGLLVLVILILSITICRIMPRISGRTKTRPDEVAFVN
ncbi:mucin-17 isoform X5 [Strongylocentrotus purpuratus]|uniref:Hyalin n=1 Tax=Strongylocentrotus purpuratus TaxID=7668 RepID=A0A7M7N510_STRPU|nr:mucin-17 isoform X5 [Strongylocentrotus purpuratus]